MAFKSVNDSQLAALSRLRLDEFAPVIQVLQDELDDLRYRLTYAEDDTLLHRLQGRAQLITDFLALVEQSGSRRSQRASHPGRPL